MPEATQRQAGWCVHGRMKDLPSRRAVAGAVGWGALLLPWQLPSGTSTSFCALPKSGFGVEVTGALARSHSSCHVDPAGAGARVCRCVGARGQEQRWSASWDRPVRGEQAQPPVCRGPRPPPTHRLCLPDPLTPTSAPRPAHPTAPRQRRTLGCLCSGGLPSQHAPPSACGSAGPQRSPVRRQAEAEAAASGLPGRASKAGS